MRAGEALQTWLHHLPITGPGHRSQQAANEQIKMDEKSGFWGPDLVISAGEESYSLSLRYSNKEREWDLPTLPHPTPPAALLTVRSKWRKADHSALKW